MQPGAPKSHADAAFGSSAQEHLPLVFLVKIAAWFPLLWGLKHVNNAYFGPFGFQGLPLTTFRFGSPPSRRVLACGDSRKFQEFAARADGGALGFKSLAEFEAGAVGFSGI